MNRTDSNRRTQQAAAGALAAVLQYVETEVAKMCAEEVARNTSAAATRH